MGRHLGQLGGLPATRQELGAAKALEVSLIDGSGNQVTSFGGTGGTADADGSAHSTGITQGTPIQGVFENSPSTIPDQKLGTVGITNDRKLKVSGSFAPSAAGTATTANVSSTTSSTTLLAANANRLGFQLYNDATANAFVKLGAVASTSSFTKVMFPQDFWGTPDLGVNYTGIIDCIWGSSGGAMRVTELTA